MRGGRAMPLLCSLVFVTVSEMRAGHVSRKPGSNAALIPGLPGTCLPPSLPIYLFSVKDTDI